MKKQINRETDMTNEQSVQTTATSIQIIKQTNNQKANKQRQTNKQTEADIEAKQTNKKTNKLTGESISSTSILSHQNCHLT